jgi:mannosyltransferase
MAVRAGTGAAPRFGMKRPSLDCVGLIGPLALAFAIRLCGLARESFWMDEGFTGQLIQQPDLVRGLSADMHPPLYFLFVRWVAPPVDEFHLRLISAIAGALTLVPLWLLARELFGTRAAALSALLLALAPPHVWYSQEARMYALAGFFVITMTWALVVGLRCHARWPWLVYGAALAAGLYTHYYVGLTALAHGVVTIRRRAWRPFLLAGVAALLAFAPWLATLAHQLHSSKSDWIPRPTARSLLVLVAQGLTGVESDARRLLAALAVTALLVVGALVEGDRWRLRLRSDAAQLWPRIEVIVAYIAVPIVLGWLLSQRKPMFVFRYFLPALIPLYVLIALGITRRPSITAQLALSTLVVGGLGLQLARAGATRCKPDFRGAVERIVATAAHGDIVAVAGYGAEAWIVQHYAAGRIPVRRVDAQLCASASGRVWLIGREEALRDVATQPGFEIAGGIGGAYRAAIMCPRDETSHAQSRRGPPPRRR